jgi:hypothetical protein
MKITYESNLNTQVVHIGGDWQGYGIIIAWSFHSKHGGEITVKGKSGRERTVPAELCTFSRNPIQRFIFHRLWRKWYTYKPPTK